MTQSQPENESKEKNRANRPNIFEERELALRGSTSQGLPTTRRNGKPLSDRQQRRLDQIVALREEMSVEFFKDHPEYADLSHEELMGKMDADSVLVQRKHKRRLREHIEVFSDAIIAIIITIMLLEIGVPSGNGSEEYLPFLLNIGIFLISFFILADLWFDHHRLFDGIEEISEPVAVLDFIFLAMLSVLPLLTKWIMVEPTSLAVLNYGLILTVIRVFMNLIMLFIARDRYKDMPKTREYYMRVGVIRLISALVINLLVMAIAVAFPMYGHWLFIVIPLFSFIGTASSSNNNQPYYR